jgi:hypothetical protein
MVNLPFRASKDKSIVAIFGWIVESVHGIGRIPGRVSGHEKDRKNLIFKLLWLNTPVDWRWIHGRGDLELAGTKAIRSGISKLFA